LNLKVTLKVLQCCLSLDKHQIHLKSRMVILNRWQAHIAMLMKQLIFILQKVGLNH